MKHRIPAVVILLVGIVGSLGAQVLDRPVAIVRLTETVNIGARELTKQLAAVRQTLGRDLTGDENRQILDALVDDELLLQGAVAAGVTVTQDEITNYVALQRQQFSQQVGRLLSEAEFRTEIERQTGDTYQKFVQDVSEELIKLKYVRLVKADLFQRLGTPTDDEVEQLYTEQQTSFTNPAMVRFRHVFIDLRGKTEAQRAEARALLQGFRRQITNGTLTYSRLEEMSLDDPAYSAADFGYLVRGDAESLQLLGRTFVDRVFAMEKGQVDGVFESNVAVHIVSVTDKRPVRILELDDPVFPGEQLTVRQQIRNLLAVQKEQNALAVAVGELVDQLRETAEVTLYLENAPW